VLESSLRRFKFRLPSLVLKGCKELVVTEGLITDPEKELSRLEALYADQPAEQSAQGG